MNAALALLYQSIAPRLALVEREIAETLDCPQPEIASLLEVSGRYGGKRMRPALVLLVASELGCADERHVRLAAVTELIHLATLVHDDVIDEADLRRNVQTVNAANGNYEAVLLGDIIFARAIHLLARLGDRRSLLVLTRAVSTLCEGEILQNRHRRDPELTESTYYSVIGGKTAELYAAGAGLAAHVAAASEGVVEAFSLFGEKLGLAFQIIDDCLDITGDEREVGKSLGTDLRNGKVTLPVILLREAGGEDERALVRKVFSADCDAASSAQLRRRLVEDGFIRAAAKVARSHVDEGLSALRRAVGRPLPAMEAIGQYVLERSL
jgi:octaprenyl-diphosphate synthase